MPDLIAVARKLGKAHRYKAVALVLIDEDDGVAIVTWGRNRGLCGAMKDWGGQLDWFIGRNPPDVGR